MIKNFNDYLKEDDILSREDKIEAILLKLNDEKNDSSDIDDYESKNDEEIDKLYLSLFGVNEDAVTTASPGSGTAVAGPGSGDAGMTFTSAAGTSYSGGDSGTSFSTNSNVSGMGAIRSAQPSATPGDVRGSTKGSGDIGSRGGTFSKAGAVGAVGKLNKKQQKNKKKTKKRSKIATKIDNLSKTDYTKDDGKGNVIKKWETYKESWLFDKFTKKK